MSNLYNKIDAKSFNSGATKDNIEKFLFKCGIYCFMVFALEIMHIAFTKITENPYSDLWSIVLLLPIVLFVAMFAYHRRKAQKSERHFDLFLIDLWGFAFVLSLVLVNILNRSIGQMTAISVNYLVYTCIIGTCIFVTGDILKSHVVRWFTFVYFALNLLYFVKPNITIIANELTFTFSTSILFNSMINVLAFIVICKCLKTSGKKRRQDR